MGKLYNVNLETRECYEEIEIDVWQHVDLDETLEAIREAAQGLTNPELRAESGGYADDGPKIILGGHRLLTDAEVENIVRTKAKEAAYRQELQKLNIKHGRR
jgi:hypothetical protein